ncbi:hypothetical protein PAXRUDRAFT_526947 [Paxillus rubicundulus Ve08.2h10]|uniref:Unplaced genomic scaffold scaffold_38, whole genome shotgun sequence n=1 Tax=Paxillus rubicundulus Ve08.2h10 TaxID=930991 RepID=A0A0D0E9I6_9AGAM|nr:hypothetical protein PAXRUDRAFT_526947 [Paxillus rubicundulus Ve08.2h10]
MGIPCQHFEASIPQASAQDSVACEACTMSTQRPRLLERRQMPHCDLPILLYVAVAMSHLSRYPTVTFQVQSPYLE